MKVAIMQPTFLPWLGYFALINNVDTFVFLDMVQFEARSWQQRNRILINNEVRWLTIPTSRPSGRATKISEVVISKEHFSGEIVNKTLTQAYGKKPGFDFIEHRLFQTIMKPPIHLSVLNIELIKEMSKALGFETTFISASDIGVTGSKADLLLDICKKLSATTYISPPGSRVYLDTYKGFEESEIELEYQTFIHPVYPQGKFDFISHMSSIDAICNINLDATRELIRNGSRTE